MKQMLIILLVLIPLLMLSKETDFNRARQKSSIYIREYMKKKQIPGMSVAVRHLGKPVWSDGFGYSNLELKVPAKANTRFRIASVSKPLTAVLTAYLFQQEQIDIDAPVNDLLPNLSNLKWPVTIRQLMHHAAGIRHYRKNDIQKKSYHDSITRGMKIIETDPLLYKPGSRFSYSSYGYNIIGAYLEKRMNNTFESLLHDYLFKPLNMSQSVIDHPYRIIPNRSAPYVLDRQRLLINAPFFDNRYKIPSGGILSTSEDLVRLGDRIIDPAIGYLKKRTIDMMFTPYSYRDEKESDTGFGWVVMRDKKNRRHYFHLGGNSGGCAALLIYPDPKYRLVVCWLGNLDANWSDKPIKQIASFFLDAIDP
mgnify:CR=1 FL=1